MITYFVVQTFQRGKKGVLIADTPRQARDKAHCLLLAEKLSGSRPSVVAFSRTGDPETGEWEDAVVLYQAGDLPSELMEMAS